MSLDIPAKESLVTKADRPDRQSKPAFLGDLLDTLTERGRNLLGRRGPAEAPVAAPDLATLGEQLLSRRGEASGVALARALASAFEVARAGGAAGLPGDPRRPLRSRPDGRRGGDRGRPPRAIPRR